MKNNRMVEVSVSTLNALKKLVFNAEGGTDLSPIVNDIAGYKESAERDLTAINVGLSFRGIIPDMDERTRYGNYSSWNNSYQSYTFEHYSLILDRVTYMVLTHQYKDGQWTIINKENPSICTCSLGDWLERDTENDKYIARCQEKKEEK